LCSVLPLRPSQHSIGYTGDGFYRSKDPNNRIKSTEGNATRTKYTHAQTTLYRD